MEITGESHKFIFSLVGDKLVSMGEIGFNMFQVRWGIFNFYSLNFCVLITASYLQRKWAMISVETKIHVSPFSFDLRTHSINVITLEAEFLNKKTYV